MDSVELLLIVLLEPRGHIYSSIKINLKYKTRQDQILVYHILSNNPYTQYHPAVTTVARQTVRLEKNLKVSQQTPLPHPTPSRNGRCIAEPWLE